MELNQLKVPPRIVTMIRITDIERAIMLARYKKYVTMPEKRLRALAKTELEYGKWMLVAHLMQKDFGKEACDRFINAFEVVGGV